ncbi:hypothetical protein HFP15_16555 [Amycolatopsis sp. K13G38]|uniref:Histidine kinase n=1 Tax=Amycolatopsis acididurans TaxID=2724524 RepID=A0ABX1J414_9PSEU|nr:hypothetical protein [Amycolatopsis acididurans]NKQ54493.1 hypothetical protein [Amycolatopsis acididurans]
MITVLVTGALLTGLVLAGRYLLRARRAIVELHRELTGSTLLMARLNVDVAEQLFLRGDVATAARFEELATRLESLAEQQEPGRAKVKSGH